MNVAVWDVYTGLTEEEALIGARHVDSAVNTVRVHCTEFESFESGDEDVCLFGDDMTGKRCFGLSRAQEPAFTPDHCKDHCCRLSNDCGLWLYSYSEGCWIAKPGEFHSCIDEDDWFGGIERRFNLPGRHVKIDLSTNPYNLLNPNGRNGDSGYWSQVGQDEIVDVLLRGRNGLFFVESGGYDGETDSNSLFFEIKRKWQGMIIEPNPHLYKKIRNKNRKCMTVNAAISPHEKDDNLPFLLAGGYGGFETFYSQAQADHTFETLAQINNENNPARSKEDSGQTVLVTCFPLQKLLEAGNQTSLVVDYWSLDTEGSEPSILKATDFSKITVGVLSVEHHHVPERKMTILESLKSSGLVLYGEVAQDFIFVNPTYFHERGIQLEECESLLTQCPGSF
jgi:hypothetical protein